MTDLSVVIPALNEGPNLALLLPALRAQIEALGLTSEVLVITRGQDAATREAADGAGARDRPRAGYGVALRPGYRRARGHYILTMDADLTQGPTFVRRLWEAASRRKSRLPHVTSPGGRGHAARRYLLSRMLNWFFRRG